MVLAQPPVPRIEVVDALKWAWAKTFANPLIIAWIPLSLLAMALVVSGLVSVVGEDNGALIAAIGIPMALLWGLMVALGLYTAALRIARGEKVTLRSLVVPPHGFDAAAPRGPPGGVRGSCGAAAGGSPPGCGPARSCAQRRRRPCGKPREEGCLW